MDIVSKRFCMLYILQVQNTVDNLMNKKMLNYKTPIANFKEKMLKHSYLEENFTFYGNLLSF